MQIVGMLSSVRLYLKDNQISLLISLAFPIVYSLIVFYNHHCFRTFALDLGVYTNALYDYSHLQWNDAGVFKTEARNLLSDHLDLSLILIAPFSLLFGQYTLLLESTSGTHYTIPEYIEKIKALQTDKDGNTIILYTNHADEQHAYISAANGREYDVLRFEGPLDNHFTGYLEQHNEKLQCKRVDADALDKLISSDSSEISLLNETETKVLLALFEAANRNTGIKFTAEALSPADALITVTESEYDRRMRDMSRMNGFNMFGNMPLSYQTVLNTNHPSAKKLLSATAEDAKSGAEKALNLAMLAKGLLKGEGLTNFIRSEFEKL